MTPIISLPFIILAIIIVLAVIAIPIFKAKEEEYKRTGKRPKGHYTGIGMAIGLGIGMPLGMAIGESSLGIPIGLCLGLAIGSAWEKKHEKELRELTPKEKKLQRKAIFVAIGLLVIGIAVFLFISMTNKNKPVNTNTVTNFEECLAAGNPAMESYPRQCRHGDKTYVEQIPETTGMACTTSTECQVPMKYMVQSNCPYQAFCRDNECVVACPQWEHSPNLEESISYKVSCSTNDDCDCSAWDISNKYPCECLDGQCASIVETKN